MATAKVTARVSLDFFNCIGLIGLMWFVIGY